MKIFISYGHDRVELVRSISDYLSNLGYDVWMDIQKIYSGEDWRVAIVEGMLNSDAVLVFLSSHSLREGSVCLDEIKISVMCNRHIIRPIITEKGLDDRIPITIRSTQYFDFTDWEEFLKNESSRKRRFEQINDELVRLQNDPYPTQMETLFKMLRPNQKTGNLIRNLEKPYHCRKWLEKLVLQEIEKKENRPLLLVGFPGAGKSSFCYHFFWENECAVSLLVLRWGEHSANDCRIVIRNMAYQIASKIASFRTRLLWRFSNSNISLELLSEAELFELLIIEPFMYEIDGCHEKFLIIIDCVDAALNDDDSLLSQLISKYTEALPSFVQFLVTTRNNPAVLRYFDGTKQIELVPSDYRIRKDIIEYLDSELGGVSARSRERLNMTCDGSFLVANLLVQGIREGIIDINGDELLPKNIYALYFLWMQRIVSVKEYETEYCEAFSILAATAEPISVLLFADILKWRRRKLMDFFQKFRQFLVEDTERPDEKRIALFHNSFRKWIDSEDAGIYCVDSQEGIQLLSNGLLDRYESGAITGREQLLLWEYLEKAGQKEKLSILKESDSFLGQILKYSEQTADDPASYLEHTAAIEIAEKICTGCNDSGYKAYCRDVKIPLIKGYSLFCAGDHLGCAEVFKTAISGILQYGTEEEIATALYFLGTSSDLIGQRDRSRECFVKLLEIAETADDAYYKKSALVGLAWNSHFTDVSMLNRYLQQLSSMTFESEHEEQIYRLLEARVLLSRGDIASALRSFSDILPCCPREIWGYDMQSTRSQMLMIEAVVACYDSEKYDLGIQYGNQLQEKLANRGTIAECYCASWVAMNCIANGFTEDGAAFLDRAERINKLSNSTSRSQWITMHLTSVRAYYLWEIGEEERALQLHQKVVEMAVQCSDPWVLGDAYFSIICLSQSRKKEPTYELVTTVSKLREIAVSSQLPHLLFKSKLADELVSEKLNRSCMLELAKQIAENTLPSTDMIYCAYLCRQISLRHREMQLYEMYDRSLQKLISHIASENQNGKFSSRVFIQKLKKGEQI